MEQQKVQFTREEIIPFIKDSWRGMQNFLRKQREKHGARYNNNNVYEQVSRRFGNAQLEPEKYLDEYLLICEKKSAQPANVRGVIYEVVYKAVSACLSKKLREAKARKEAENGNK